MTDLSEGLITDICKNADELTEIVKKAELFFTRHNIATSSLLECFRKAQQELVIEVGANHELHMQNNEAILASKETEAHLANMKKMFGMTDDQAVPTIEEAQSKLNRNSRDEGARGQTRSAGKDNVHACRVRRDSDF